MTTILDSDTLAGAIVEREELPDGTVVWVARDIELDGCLAQDETREGAIAALDLARQEYRAVLQDLQRKTPLYVTIIRDAQSGALHLGQSFTSVAFRQG